MFAPAPWDRWLFGAINGARHPLLDMLLPLVSVNAALWVLVGGAVGCAALRHGRRMLPLALAVSGVVAVSDLTCSLVKGAAARPRPLAVERGVWAYDHGWRQWAEPPGAGRSSFPSAHAANAMAAAVVLVAWGRWRRAWLLFPLAVAYARVYVGKHYPADVLAGLALGLAVGLAAVAVLRRFTSPGAAAPGG